MHRLSLDYPTLYMQHYGRLPDNWLTGIVMNVRVGYSADRSIRMNGASGGILTSVLIYLLKTGMIDGAILAKQGTPDPLSASPVIVHDAAGIIECAGSVYTEVSMLEALDSLVPGQKYAITCTSECSAKLRQMQSNGDCRALQIAYVLGPYTGTALMREALNYYLESNRIAPDDKVTSLKWRAGEWPGYLEILTEHGRIIRSPKVYYNFLIPFFITETSLLSMDFYNEFADLSVGDAWSNKYEGSHSGGVSVFTARTAEMEKIVSKMCEEKLLECELTDPLKAADMHGHMLDFKKRGGYIRSRILKFFGREYPDYGYKPTKITFRRICVELVICMIFVVCRTRLARYIVCKIPEHIIGPCFNRLRLLWKAISRPTKRRGLSQYDVVLTGKTEA